MVAYPVHLAVDRPARFTRIQLLVRILAFMVLGMLGLSLGSLFLVAYVALPVFAAARLTGGADPQRYLDEDGPRIARVLGWLAAIYAWFGLVSDKLPVRSPEETVHLEIEPSGRPTAGAALIRLLAGLPSAFALALLGCIGGFVWLWAALVVLVRERVGDGSHGFLLGLQRWSMRLLAYQAALVEPYPPFSLEDRPLTLPPQSRPVSQL